MKKIWFLVAITLVPTFSHAITKLPFAVPTSWVLRWTSTASGQPATLYATNTGSTCNLTAADSTALPNALSFTSNATSVDQRVFYNTIEVAKLTGKMVMVAYDEKNNCAISYFGIQ